MLSCGRFDACGVQVTASHRVEDLVSLQVRSHSASNPLGLTLRMRMRMHCAVVYCPGACERLHCLCWLAARLTRSVLGSQRSIVDQRQLRVIFKRSTFTIKFVSARLRHIFCQVSFPCAGTPQHGAP